MDIIPTQISALMVVETKLIYDERGSFARLFCDDELKDVLGGKPIRQINQSVTKTKGAIRGLHFQKPPFSEIKCVRCLRGRVFDVAVDLRENSETFLHWHGEVLSEDNARMMVIPEGFAHGFQTLEDDCELLYCHSQRYHPEAEDGLYYADPTLEIDWPLPPGMVSQRDQGFPMIAQRGRNLL